jgi:T5SS/PEP-CTERM-associated repeat protein
MVRGGCKIRFVVSGRVEAAGAMETKQHRSSISREVLTGLGFLLILTAPLRAQYTANYQTNIISGVTSNWSGIYYVGNINFADALLIRNAGVLSSSWGYDGAGYIGYGTSASNNFVLVSGSGSVWSNSGTFGVGLSGAANTLVISNGGKVAVTSPVDPPVATYIGRDTTASNNYVLVTGSGSALTNPGTLYVGQNGSGNALTISNGGRVISASDYLGGNGSGSSNVVVVTGSGSVWYSLGSLTIGWGIGNRLLITDGGKVNHCAHGLLGYKGSDNVVTVNGIGSIWSNRDVQVGVGGAGNQLVITNSGTVYDSLFGCLGCGVGGSNNSALVTGSGSAWYNGTLYVGQVSGGSQLELRDGGSVVASNAYVGYYSGSAGNQINITGGSLYVTNAAQNGVLDVRCGTLTLSSGVLQADILIVTNPCGRLIHNGGMLVCSNLVLDPNLSAVGDGIPNGWKQQFGFDPFDPNLASADPDGDGFTNLQEFRNGTDPLDPNSTPFRITAITQEDDDIRIAWMAGTGKTNALQTAVGNGGYDTNAFADIFIVTNTIGNVTNYLDVGGATNAPSRYYRVRLVP